MSEKNSIGNVNNIFEQPWWLDIVAPNNWQEIIIQNKNNECIGRLPVAQLNLYGIDYLGMPPLTQTLGPWFKEEKGVKITNKLKNIKKISEEFIQELDKYNNIDLCFNNTFQYLIPFIWHGYSVEPRYSYIIKNLDDLDAVFNNIDSKVKNLIKNAKKNIEITNDVSAEELVRLLECTFSKQNRNLPINNDLIKNIYEKTKNRSSGEIIGAKDIVTGKILSAAFFVYDKNTCYYLLGGKDYNCKINGVQELVLLEGIKLASTVSRKFDFEGSMIPGIESFFRGFGGEPVVYYRVFKGHFIFRFMYWLKPIVKKILGYK